MGFHQSSCGPSTLQTSLVVTAQTTSWNAMVLPRPHVQIHVDRPRRPHASGLVIGDLFLPSELAQRVLGYGQP